MNEKCRYCGFPKSEHITISYAGAILIDTPYICPTSAFQSRKIMEQKEKK